MHAILTCLLLPVACLAQPLEPATRADAGLAYLRVERALASREHTHDERRQANLRFDQATSLFFSGRLDRATRALNDLAAELRASPRSAATSAAESLVARPEPSILFLDEPAPLTLRLASLYAEPGPRPLTLRLALIAPDHAVTYSTPITLDADQASISLPIPLDPMTLEPGRYTITLADPDFPAAAVEIGFWAVTPTRPSAIRASVEERLGPVGRQPTPPGNDPIMILRPILTGAKAMCLARAGLLDDSLPLHSSASILLDPAALASEVVGESLLLAEGFDPYAGRLGDWWTSFDLDGVLVPARVYIPPALADNPAPRPLVIALHGAGGDEHLFMNGYGAGVLKDLADSHRFIALSPLTYNLAGRPDALARLIDAVDAIARPRGGVDRNRVFLLGHSLGGGAASLFAARADDHLAAVACLAGAGPLAAAPSCAPTLIYAAELDPIIPASRLRLIARRAAEAGLPVEYREASGQGHTLVVGDILPEVIEWLLARPQVPR